LTIIAFGNIVPTLQARPYQREGFPMAQFNSIDRHTEK
jgi:hypothetical protein